MKTKININTQNYSKTKYARPEWNKTERPKKYLWVCFHLANFSWSWDLPGMSFVYSVKLYCRTLGFTSRVSASCWSLLDRKSVNLYPLSCQCWVPVYTKLFSLCVCCNNLREFICASALFYPENTVSLCHQSSLALTIFPTSFFP